VFIDPGRMPPWQCSKVAATFGHWQAG